ncbi:MAG: response regulator transcription factor, partial [Planctomycetota bacterium]
MIRVLLVDDQALFCEGLRTLLDLQPDIEVVGEANNGREAIECAARAAPDVVLMDVRMPVLDGVAATRDIRAHHPNTQVIVLTTFDDDEYVFEALRAGAVGYLLKDVASDRLAEAIRSAARGESFLQPSVAAKVVAEYTRLADAPPTRTRANQALIEPLSDRELEILR